MPGVTHHLNHPKKGATIKVYPIRRIQDIKAVKKYLKNNPRDLAIFTLGINSALRASDLLAIKMSQVKHLKKGEHFEIIETKTKKRRFVTINGPSYDAIRNYLDNVKLYHGKEALLFQASRSVNKPLEVSTLNKKLKKWCKWVGLKENYGSHTLRKTFGYHQRKTFGTDIPTLMTAFNHSNQKQTLTYLCIQDDEIYECFMNEL